MHISVKIFIPKKIIILRGRSYCYIFSYLNVLLSFLVPVGLNRFVRVHYMQVKEVNHKMLLIQASQHILYFLLRPVCIIYLFIFAFIAAYLFLYVSLVIIVSIFPLVIINFC